MKNFALSILALLLITTSCNNTATNPTEASNAPEVSKTESDLRDIWVLTEMLTVDLDTINYAEGKPRLELNPTDSTVLGFTGCNNLNAALTASENGGLTFGPLATTRKYCFDVPEAQFLDYLTQTVRYNRNGLFLELYNDSTKVLTFKKVD